jgi:choline dehydrogenase-like flavoprotein
MSLPLPLPLLQQQQLAFWGMPMGGGAGPMFAQPPPSARSAIRAEALALGRAAAAVPAAAAVCGNVFFCVFQPR